MFPCGKKERLGWYSHELESANECRRGPVEALTGQSCSELASREDAPCAGRWREQVILRREHLPPGPNLRICGVYKVID